MVTFAINIPPMLAYIPYIWDIVAYGFLWFPMVSRSEVFHVDTGRCGSQTAPSRRHLGEQRDRSQKAQNAIMALGFLDIFGRFWDKIGLCCP
jgi:hypothetical protein